MNKKLKIAVFHNLPKGGAIKALQDNCNYLKKNGHSIDVYIPDTADESFAPLNEIADNYFKYPVKKSIFRKIILDTVKKLHLIHISKNSKFYVTFKDFRNTQRLIAEDINNEDYDIVIVEQDSFFTLTPALSMYIEKPFIYYCDQPFRNNEQILKKLNDDIGESIFLKIINKHNTKYIKLDIDHAQYCDNILVNSYFTHENVLEQYGMNSQVSYLGIDTTLFRPLNIERKNFILSVGGIAPRKGFDFVINSIARIDKNIRPKLKIVGYAGDENWLNYLYELANSNEVDLEVLNNISYEELVILYNEAKAFIFSAYLEPFGLVSLEALACGTPVITVKEGGIREIVKHMENGLLLDRDEETFAKGISELLTNQELWHKLSENGKTDVNNFWTLNHAGERLLNHIYRILNKKH